MVAARNMFDVATAAATFPTVETVILAEAPPRIDEMAEYAKHGNDELNRLWQDAELALREKISIGKHDYLTKACPCRTPPASNSLAPAAAWRPPGTAPRTPTAGRMTVFISVAPLAR